MRAHLAALPYDVLYNLSLFLGVDDIYNLALTCTRLRTVVEEPTLCRRALMDLAGYSVEAEAARKGELCCKSFVRLCERRRRLAGAQPVTTLHVDEASSFVYGSEIAVWMNEEDVFALHLRNGNCSALGDDLRSLFSDFNYLDHSNLSFLSLKDGLLALCWPGKAPKSCWLGMVDISGPSVQLSIAPTLIEASIHLFARVNKDYLCFGTHTAIGNHGFTEWLIRTVPLHQGKAPLAEVQLTQFPGRSVGSTVAFEIHDGYFYGVTNLTSFDVTEVDFTSQYGCIRFKLDEPRCSKPVWNYRRQHDEGPVNDNWTTLSLQVDEQTNDLVICESRKEWINGGSIQTRTFYMSNIDSDQPSLLEQDGPLGPPDSALTQVATSETRYEPSQDRSSWQVHPERSHTVAFLEDCTSGAYSQPDAYILTYTKFHSYNLACNSFVDIIADTSCCDQKACLRLRIGSRCLDGTTTVRPQLMTPPTTPCASEQIEKDEGYRYRPIKLWPPRIGRSIDPHTTHTELNLFPQSLKPVQAGAIHVQAALDGSGLVYLVKESEQSPEGKLVFVCFDQGLEASTAAFVKKWRAPRSHLQCKELRYAESTASSEPASSPGGSDESSTVDVLSKEPWVDAFYVDEHLSLAELAVMNL